MKKIYTFLFAFFCYHILSAQVFVRWDFDSQIPDANTETGTISPSLDLTAGAMALPTGGSNYAFASGYPDNPIGGDNSSLHTGSYPTQGTANQTAGIRFQASTHGKSGIVVSFAQYHSIGSSRFTSLQYTTDGINWQQADLEPHNTTGTTGSVNYEANLFVADMANTWYMRVFSFSGLTALEHNPQFAFRVVTAFAPNEAGYSGVGGLYSGTGNISYDAVQIGNNATLPIHLSYFTAAVNKDNKVNLIWQTASEDGINAFHIERSTDGTSFASIETIEATGNTSGHTYSYTDEWTYEGTVFYRLRMTDPGGAISFSPTVNINMKTAVNDNFVLFPNPVQITEKLTVRFSKIEIGDIVIFDAQGRMVLHTRMNGNETSKTIDIASLPGGSYHVVFYGTHSTTTGQFIKS